MSQDWHGMTAAELGRGIGEGSIDPVALTDSFLDAIGTHPVSPRIFARTTPDRARAEARASAARARAGQRLSPLDGVPISWKDLFDSAGTATEAGSALLRGRVPDRDAQALANATAAGLVCLGKTHMTELAFSGLGYNPVTASPPCINDADAVSGGSSSGAATSVAFGLAAAGIGSDTGGSVRVPAAWNDLVGLKTTAGSLPLDGVVPLCPRFDSLGPLCRTAEDAALLFGALRGDTAPDLAGSGLPGRRFLVLETTAFDDIEDAPRKAFLDAVDGLRDGGAKIAFGEVPAVAAAMPLSPILFATEAYGTWKELIESDPDAMFASVRERFRGGEAFSGVDYVAAWQRLDRLRADYAEATTGYDAVILPTCAILPPPLARLQADADYFADRNLMTLRNTRIGNLMGLPAITVPTGRPSCGLMIQTGAGTETRLLRLAAAIEAALA